MRLVCPNCEAKYEVPEDAIPETGRDVQCANCGHAWYQMRARAAAPEAAPPPVAAPVAPEPEPEPMAAPEAPAAAAEPAEAPPVEPAPEAVVVLGAAEESEVLVGDGTETNEAVSGEIIADAAVEAEGVVAAAETVAEAAAVAEIAVAEVADETLPAVVAEPTDAGGDRLVSVAGAMEETPVAAADSAALVEEPDAVPPATDAVPAAAAAYAVDDSVLAILREEAEREVQARRAETKPLEVQQDLGVDTVHPAPRLAEAHAADPIEADDDAMAKPSARRDLLPDVEEINSTLRPSEQPGDDAAPMTGEPVVEGRSSFRSGFLVVMTIAILGAALYIAAPMLRDAVPALAGFLDAYIGFVDGLRLQLDGLMQSATMAMGGASG